MDSIKVWKSEFLFFLSLTNYNLILESCMLKMKDNLNQYVAYQLRFLQHIHLGFWRCHMLEDKLGQVKASAGGSDPTSWWAGRYTWL